MPALKLYKPYDERYNKTHEPPIIRSQAIVDEASALSEDFYKYVQAAWVEVEGQPFKPAWFPESLCIHMEATYWGYITNLIINCPPRMGKSTIVSVLFNSWVWIKEPHLKFMFASYGQSLAERDSRKTLELIRSDWYQKRWGHIVKLNRSIQQVDFFANTAKGERFTTSVESRSTGFGGHWQIFDDLNNIQHVKSQADRDNVNRFVNEVTPTRLADPLRNCRIITQQRGHVEDASGFVIANDTAKRWVVYSLPMEYETASKCITYPYGNDEAWQDPREIEGELLHPDWMPEQTVEEWKDYFHQDEYIIAGQLQQRPFPLGGGMIKSDWFKWWFAPHLPTFKFILQSWDTATSDKTEACFSACTTWGVFENETNPEINDVMLLSVWQDRLIFPDLHDQMERLWRNYEDVDRDYPYPVGYVNHPHLVLVEAMNSGRHLIDVLNKTDMMIMGFDPKKYGDKTHRVVTISHLIANGRIWLRTSRQSNYNKLTEQSELFLKYVTMFAPNSPNDITDTTSQAFLYLEENGWLIHSGYRRRSKEVWSPPDYSQLKKSDMGHHLLSGQIR